MGFFNLQLTVSMCASTADISLPPDLPLPAHLCLPPPSGIGGQPETVQRVLQGLAEAKTMTCQQSPHATSHLRREFAGRDKAISLSSTGF
ncbi:hypothetical protein SynBOUM118_02337 [Synechococcus sp. BOUM118]|nr:hypothetical protein SynBOUM118_02337 [Synechococcus sp. BOUM118]